MIKLKKVFLPDKQEMRKTYADALIKTAGEDERLLVLDCDLAASIGTKGFYDAFPDRAYNCGIAEANACSMAAGLSVTGFVPFVHSFAVFTSRRMYDQAFISCAYAGRNVKLIGGDAGITTAANGGTHMAFEDMGIMRNIPKIRVIEPSDPVQLKQLVPQMAAYYGVEYMRMNRKTIISIYEEESTFTIGQAAVLREGGDVSIIACGIMVHEALLAAEALQAQGIAARVVDMFTIKPIDTACVLECARLTGAIVTAENHSVYNALGSAVAEVLVEGYPVPMERVGIRDEFGEVGTQEELAQRFRLTAGEIVLRAKAAIARKG